MRFGEKLKDLRQAAALSQSALAKKSGLSVRNIQNWEIGHRIPRADALFKLASALGTTCEAFADYVEAPAPPAPPKKKPKPRGNK